MTNNELKLLQSAMDHSKSYLEFGSGNSTYMAVATDNIKKITVVESDVTFWETHLMSTPALYEAGEKGRLHPYLVNIGVTGKWGYPMNDNNRDYWPAYHSCVFSLIIRMIRFWWMGGSEFPVFYMLVYIVLKTLKSLYTIFSIDLIIM